MFDFEGQPSISVSSTESYSFSQRANQIEFAFIVNVGKSHADVNFFSVHSLCRLNLE